MEYVKTLRVSPKGQISIPKDARDALGIEAGEQLIMLVRKKQILIEKSSDLLKELGTRVESLENMLVSEGVLKKDWDNEYDDRWNKY